MITNLGGGSLLVVIAFSALSPFSDAHTFDESRAQQLRSLGAENVREIDGELLYVKPKDSRFSDDAASMIEDQQSIVFLSVAQTPITGTTLRSICKLKQMKWLFLDSSKVTD